MVRLDISNDGKHTGALLQQYLADRGVYDEASPNVVCYGAPRTHERHMLNGNRTGKRRGKIPNMQLMAAAGCRTVPYFIGVDVPSYTRFPLLARKNHGMGGTDIVPVFQAQEVPWRVKAGWEWFSSYVPLVTEYRVWMFRGQALDTFEKVMVRPTDYTRIGRNFDNGFDFQYTASRKDVTAQSALALDALGLDFGAIDLLLGEDNNVYVLEVNTAPGALKSKAESTVAKLADCIQQWNNDGFPERL